MDSKLKALKVVQLKEILSKASVNVSAKSNKQDLIAKILDSPPALDVYNSIYDPKTETAPPKKDDPPPPSESKPKPAPGPASSKPVVTTASVDPVDEEAEKRKKRAERFNVPLVEPKKPRSRKAATVLDDDAKLVARAERFGTKNNKKRPAPTETIDPEEAERRKKRAERFGLAVKSSP